MKGYTLIRTHHRDGRTTHHVELWTQPTYRYLMARAYHWYDMRIRWTKLFGLMERLYDWQHGRKTRNDFFVPLGAAQDIRCFGLFLRGRRDLARLDVSAETYQAVHAVGDSQGGPYITKHPEAGNET